MLPYVPVQPTASPENMQDIQIPSELVSKIVCMWGKMGGEWGDKVKLEMFSKYKLTYVYVYTLGCWLCLQELPGSFADLNI